MKQHKTVQVAHRQAVIRRQQRDRFTRYEKGFRFIGAIILFRSLPAMRRARHKRLLFIDKCNAFAFRLMESIIRGDSPAVRRRMWKRAPADVADYVRSTREELIEPPA